MKKSLTGRTGSVDLVEARDDCKSLIDDRSNESDEETSIEQKSAPRAREKGTRCRANWDK
ncbi:hypothetical protein ACFYNM_38515 [Streptomyces spororaveus]|uniref:hypothetical protein n=1 Tax=Streptomyces spororaveus TaxID=284039 RepID=UPI0036BD60C7